MTHLTARTDAEGNVIPPLHFHDVVWRNVLAVPLDGTGVSYTGRFRSSDSETIRSVKHGQVLAETDTDQNKAMAKGSDGSLASCTNVITSPSTPTARQASSSTSSEQTADSPATTRGLSCRPSRQSFCQSRCGPGADRGFHFHSFPASDKTLTRDLLSGPRGTRTHNPRIKSPLLCQLS